MQEPHGAFTWYPVNDQPADKAFYDFTITTPSPRVGVANGQLASRTAVDSDTVTEWHLDSAASSYLITIAIADRSEEHTSELQSLLRTTSAVFCSKKQKHHNILSHSCTHKTTTK